MDFDSSRLRRGELLAGGGALVLALSLFLLPWYGVKSPFAQTASSLGASTSFDGWNGLSHIRWLVLITILASFALVWLQATRRNPALPVSFSLIVIVLGFLTLLALIYRVLINVPGADSVVDRKPGAFVGLLATLVLTYGGYRSMREEGLAPRDERTEIETLTVDAATAPARMPER